MYPPTLCIKQPHDSSRQPVISSRCNPDIHLPLHLHPDIPLHCTPSHPYNLIIFQLSIYQNCTPRKLHSLGNLGFFSFEHALRGIDLLVHTTCTLVCIISIFIWTPPSTLSWNWVAGWKGRLRRGWRRYWSFPFLWSINVIFKHCQNMAARQTRMSAT